MMLCINVQTKFPIETIFPYNQVERINKSRVHDCFKMIFNAIFGGNYINTNYVKQFLELFSKLFQGLFSNSFFFLASDIEGFLKKNY